MVKLLLREHPEIKNDISNLYLSAFPENERPPLEWFLEMVNRYEENKVIGYYEDGSFIGFTYLVFYKDIVYIAFLAVTKSQRNKGYGTCILNDIKDSYPNHIKLLCFEEVDTKYHDYENRLRRQHFYLRNGYVNNHMKTREGEVIYQSAFIGERQVEFVDYKEIFDHTYGPGSSERYLKEVI